MVGGMQRRVLIWQDCDSEVRVAMERFNERSGPFSLASKRYSFLRLIREELDDALDSYRSQLELKYTLFNVPGLSGEQPFSCVVRDLGARGTEDKIRRTLRRFSESMLFTQDDEDNRFYDTAETLLELLIHCRTKQPAKRKNVSSQFNLQRPKELCLLCGAPSEFLEYFSNHESWALIDDDEKLKLSHKYCYNHRPKHRDGTWNPEYRRAIRNRETFELEAERLLNQSAQPAVVKHHTGTLDIDRYIMTLIAQTTLQPADEDKIRNLARKIVNYRISDRKKQLLMLVAAGYKQAEIARRLNISRQAVSKALNSIPDEFRLV